jgi:hypothetical protein
VPRMTKNKRKSEMDRFLKLAQKAGIDIDQLMAELPSTEIGSEAVERRSIEAESVLFYIQTRGKGFQEKVCKNSECRKLFLHTYEAVAYCSEQCRADALAEYGIGWNFERKSDAERWNVKGKGFVPKIIGSEATAALIESGNYFNETKSTGTDTATSED